MTQTILVVDDDTAQRNIIQHVITDKLGYRGVMVGSGPEALDWVQKAKKPNPDLLLLDY